MRDWTINERRELFFKMRVFQLGLSAMVANGHIPSWLNESEAERLPMDVGDELLLAHEIKRKEQ